MYSLRPYQAECVGRTTEFLLAQVRTKKPKNGLVYMPTGGGKAICIGTTAIELARHSQGGPAVIFQPTREILQQNLEKIESYGFQAGVVSASMGRKDIGDVTLATIGSAYKHPEWFEDFQFGLIDEAHLVQAKDNYNIVQPGEEGQFIHRELGIVTVQADQSEAHKNRVLVVDEDGEEHDIPLPKQSMYKSFIEALPHLRWCGYTGSPYRLESNAMGSQLKVLTRTRPRLFDEFIHWTQNKELFDQGYLANLEYFQIPGFKRSQVQLNSNGSDYNQQALQLHLWERHWETKSKAKVNFPDKLTEIVNRLLDAGRRNALVFTSSIRESEYLAEQMNGRCAVVTGETPPAERAKIGDDFRSGALPVVANTNCWVVGFDFPRLDVIIDAAPSKSLARYQQKVGRVARVHPDKESSYCVDMAGGYEQFGPVEALHLYCQGTSRWDIFGRPGGGEERQLTSVYLGGSALVGCCPKCRAPKQVAYYAAKGKWLPISVPPAGRRGELIIKREGGKTICEMVGRGEGTHSFHFKYCATFARLREAQA